MKDEKEEIIEESEKIEKEEEAPKGILNNWKIIGVIFAAAIIVLVYNGISISIYKAKTLGENDTIGSNISGHNLINLSNSSEDKFFKDSIVQNYQVLYSDLDCIANAAKKQSYVDTAKCGKFLNEDSDRILSKINEINKSTPFQLQVVDEFKNSLENYSLGGKNLNTGATTRNASQMNDAGMQIHQGTIGINKIGTMLGTIKTGNDSGANNISVT